MNRLSLTISIFFFITYVVLGQTDEKLNITHGPYLQNVSDTAATIIFTTNKLVVPGVYLSCDGADFKLIRNSTDGLINVGDDIHKVRLTGLKPGKEYSYKLYVKEVLDMRPYVNLDGKYGDSIISEVFKFKTLDRSADEMKFTVFNDTHNKAGMISRFLDGNDIEAQDFYFYNGDIINYVKDLELPFRAFLDTSVNRFASQIPFFYVRGNHETRGTYAKEFKKFFDFPDDKYYYSFDAGSVHFTILDCGEDKPDTSAAYFGLADYDNYRLEQLEWLKREVKTESFKNASFRIVVVHMPIIEKEKNWYGMAFLAKHYGPVLQDAGINLMISGHTHRNAWISADSSGFGYPVMIASNHNFTEVTADERKIVLKLKDIEGRVVEKYEVNSGVQTVNSEQSSWFSRALNYKGIVVQDDEWNIWGCSPIMDDAGKVHLFTARWPEKTGHQGWRTDSEIAHYIADSPEGPFRFSEVVLQGTDEDTWDKYAPHNPTIHKVGNRYALFYIANSGAKKHPANQQIGLLLSELLYGPWKKAGKDGLILSPPDDRSYYNYKAGNGVVNPALLQKDGKFYLYFKSNDTRKDNKWRPKMGLAIADNIEGPYKQMKEPITKNEQIIEDGYAFEYNGKVYLVTTDNHGMIEFGGGLIWESEDGINFNEPKQAFTVLKNYLGGEIPSKAFRTKGEAGDKFERPQILMIDSKPAYIYMPSGTNVSGGKGSAGYVLKITL
jgi:predicted phosphodiesterase